MSREGIVEILSLREITVTSLVYSQTRVSVYQGKYQGLDAAVKVLLPAPGQDPLALEEEFHTLVNMQHKSIVKVFDFCWLPQNTFSYFVIVTEWCSKDLWKDIEDRRTNKYPFEEERMWSVTYQLVAAFAYMQSQGYAHQDIKPENVFLFLDGSIRVGDLGSTQYIHCSYGEKRIVGTPFYMSPALKGAVASSRRTVFHNVFKSDVYSLGLTLLCMAILGKPATLINGNEEETERVIDSVPYSSGFKDLLRNMLCENEEERGDFMDMEDWLGLRKTLQLEAFEEESLCQVADKPDSPQPIPEDNPNFCPIVEMTESQDEEESCRTICVQLPEEVIRGEQPTYPSYSQRTTPINHYELAASPQDRSRFQTSLYPAEEGKTRFDSSQPHIVEEDVYLTFTNREEKAQTDWKKSDYNEIVERKCVHSESKRMHNSYQDERKAKSKSPLWSRGRKDPPQSSEYEPQRAVMQASDVIPSEPSYPCDSVSVKCASCEAEGRFAQQMSRECSHGNYIYCSAHWEKEGVQLGCPHHCLVTASLKSRKKCASRVADSCKWLLCCWCKLC